MSKLIVEGNEVLLVEEDDLPKIRRQTIKKEEEPKFMVPFFSDDFWKFMVSKANERLPGNTRQATYYSLKYNNYDYLPLYTVGFQPPDNFPLTTYWGKYPLEKDSLENTSLAINMSIYPKIKDFWSAIIEQKHYNLLTLFVSNLINSGVEDGLVSRMREYYLQYFDTYINTPPAAIIKIPDGGSPNGAGLSRLIGKIKFQNLWRLTNVFNQTSLNYLPPTTYLTNLYFCGLYSQLRNQNGLEPTIKPLFCMVFKREYLQVIRASIISNQPIPSEWLELWVDKSLEDQENSFNIKAAYIRQIRNPLKRMGIEIVLKEDLGDELYEKTKPKEFKTFSEQLTWVNDLLERMTMHEKQKLGIS